MAANQQVTFLTDGGEDIRDLPCYLNAQAEHLLDWFHLTMRITVMANMAKSLPPSLPGPEPPDEPPADLAGEIGTQLQRLKWFCWHGNVFRALQTIDDILFDLDITEPCPEQARLFKAVRESGSYIRVNVGRIPNYGERQRAGEAISTAFIESAVNQVISKRMVKKTADALDTTRRPPATAGPHPRPQRPARQRLPPLVSRLQPGAGPCRARGVASPTLSRSPKFMLRTDKRPDIIHCHDAFYSQYSGILQLISGSLRQIVRSPAGRFRFRSRFIAHHWDWLPPAPCLLRSTGNASRQAVQGQGGSPAPHPEKRSRP